MRRKSLFAAGLALAIAGGAWTASSIAADSVFEQREALMKGLGANMKTITQFVQESKGTASDVAKAAADSKSKAAQIVALFPAGTGVDDGVETEAKMEIWQDPEGFKAAAAQLEKAAADLEAAATSGDKTAIETAFGEMGKSCGGCHSKFRVKKS